jgi:hypothetical protein
MVVKFDKFGNKYHSAPYTKAEQDEFYRRVGGGPVTVVRRADDRKRADVPSTAAAAAGKTTALLSRWLRGRG